MGVCRRHKALPVAHPAAGHKLEGCFPLVFFFLNLKYCLSSETQHGLVLINMTGVAARAHGVKVTANSHPQEVLGTHPREDPPIGLEQSRRPQLNAPAERRGNVLFSADSMVPRPDLLTFSKSGIGGAGGVALYLNVPGDSPG